MHFPLPINMRSFKLLPKISLGLLCLSMFLLSGCHAGLRSNLAAAETLDFIELKAINLSEGLTKNDEIEMHTFFIRKDQSNPITKINYFVFDESNKSLPVSNQFNLIDPTGYVVVVLVEQDVEEDNSHNNNQLLFTELSKQTFIDNPREVLRLDELIGDDDVLDLQYLDIQKLKANTSSQLRFEGLHFFDRFEYTLSYKIN